MNVAYFELDKDRIDPWYDDLRTRIIEQSDKYPQLKVKDDFIYKSNLFHPYSQTFQIVVPKPQRSNVIGSCDDIPLCAHLEFYKTLNMIQERYFWPKMRKYVMKFVRRYHVCNSQKVTNMGRIGVMRKEKIAQWPFQIIILDLMGLLPMSKKGNR